MALIEAFSAKIGAPNKMPNKVTLSDSKFNIYTCFYYN